MIREVGELLALASWARLSPSAKEKLEHCVIANLSVAVAGLPYVRLPEPAEARGACTLSPLRRFAPLPRRGARALGRPCGAHFLFSGRRAARARDAAFWNAAVMHARTQDDFHPIGNLHAATVMVPAAIAAAEAADSSGEQFLDALVAGYSAAAGLSCAFSSTTTPKGLRSTGLYAPFASAASAGRLAGLDAAGLGNAIALVASVAGGLTQCWVDGSDEWQLHVAQAAANGLHAVELTLAGVKGGAHALDGKAGFYHAHAGVVPEFAAIEKDFDIDRAILDTVIKRYPVSGICQPVVRLAERLAARHAIDAHAIEHVTIWMNPFEMHYPGTLNKGPFRSFSDVLMSASFCCASVLACGRFEFGDLFDLGRQDRNRLIDATQVLDDAALPTLGCRIEIRLQGGGRLDDAIIDGGNELAIDSASIDEWAIGLWKDAARSETQYREFRAAVDGLERGMVRDLLQTLQP